MTTTLSVAVASLLKHCGEERPLAANTLSAYKQDTDEFLRRFSSKSIADVSGESLVDYASYLSNARKLAPATVRRRIACLKPLFGWLLRERVVSITPFATVELRIRIPDRLPRCLTRIDMRRLLLAAEKAPLLTRLSTFLLYTTGVRVSEPAAIRLSDIDRDSGDINIVGKGNTERQVFFPTEELSPLIDRYVSRHPRDQGPDLKLFVSPA